MATAHVATTDAEIDAALDRAKALPLEPLAETVEHVPAFDLLVVGLSTAADSHCRSRMCRD